MEISEGIFCPSVISPLSREKASVSCASRFPAKRAIGSSTAGFPERTVGKFT